MLYLSKKSLILFMFFLVLYGSVDLYEDVTKPKLCHVSQSLGSSLDQRLSPVTNDTRVTILLWSYQCNIFNVQ